MIRHSRAVSQRRALGGEGPLTGRETRRCCCVLITGRVWTKGGRLGLGGDGRNMCVFCFGDDGRPTR